MSADTHSSQSERVLVTGVTGFIGSRLAARLRDTGWCVRGSGRQPQEGGADAETSYIRVDELSGNTEWRRALRDIDTVIHLASSAHEALRREADYYQTVIVDGSRRLAEQAAACGVRRLIYVSSVKAVAESTRGNPLTPGSAPEPEDIYGRCKLAAERAINAVAADAGVEVVTVRPPMVYGPGVRGNFLRLLRLVDKAVPLPLGLVRNARSLVYVDNLCDLLRVCVVDNAAAGKTLFVSDGEDVSTPDLIRTMSALLGRRTRLLPVPMVLLRTLAKATGQSDQVRKLCGSLQVDITETQRIVNWSPTVSLAQGLASTVDWYKARYR